MTTSRAVRNWPEISPLLTVTRKAGAPLHRQIYESYRARIARGDLRPGQLVPSSRELARELEISRIPVLNAYAQLFAEGYFETRVGAGTFVSSSLPDQLMSCGREPAAISEPELGPRRIASFASRLPRYETPAWLSGDGPFNAGRPALDAFPFRVWSSLLTRYSRKLQAGDLEYQNSMGLYELRDAIATYLRTARAVRCEAQQVMIVRGSQQALDITARVLLDPGTPVWVEEPGYWLLQDVLKAAACRLIPVPVDAEGLEVAAGIKLCRKARAAFVAPSHQFPLGVTMSASRRLQLLEWARSSGSWIIEDDYDSEYRYVNRPIASLQGLDRYSRVIYIGTFSKVLFPSLRLGYIVIPPDLVERFVAVRRTMDICPSHASQAVLADFIREGHFARHIRRMRLLYSDRRNVLAEAIQREFGSRLKILGEEAGMHLTVLLGKGMRDRDISACAARKHLWLWPLSPSYLGGTPRHGFILGFGNTEANQIPAAVHSMKLILNA